MLRSAYDAPSASSSSVAASTASWTAARLGVGAAFSPGSTDVTRLSLPGAPDLTHCQVSGPIPVHGQPARPHHAGRRRDDHRRAQAHADHAHDATAALRALGAPAVD